VIDDDSENSQVR